MLKSTREIRHRGATQQKRNINFNIKSTTSVITHLSVKKKANEDELTLIPVEKIRPKIPFRQKNVMFVCSSGRALENDARR